MKTDNNPGLLIVLSGPAGSGKTTLSRMLAERREDCELSLSATTRESRANEKDGVDYFFLTVEEFERRKKAGDFAESAKVFGNYYGTPLAFLRERLSAGKNVVMDIDVQGAMTLMEIFPKEVFVFIVPKSKEILKQRLVDRKRDDAEEIKRRLEFASKEMEKVKDYRYLIVNDILEKAYQELESILIAERCKRAAQNFRGL